MRSGHIALLLLAAATPWVAAASVLVTEVAYDVEGSDTAREWVEFKTDAEITDIRTWRFLEGGVRHKISGDTGVVAAGSTFTLAANKETFQAEHPNYTGLVFDTAMSLSNTGETITLLDEKGNVVVTYAYTAAPKPAPQPKQKTEALEKSRTEPRLITESTTASAHSAAPSDTLPLVALAAVVIAGLCGIMYLERH